MSIIKLKYKLLNNNNSIPTRGHEDDAGLDLIATSVVKSNWHSVWYNTDIAVQIPKGYFGLLTARSSISNEGLLQISNSVGIIDPGYVGGMQVRMNRTLKGIFKYIFSSKYQYNVGDRISQLVIIPFATVVLEKTDKFSNSKRGIGGFGSTNKI